MVMYDKVMVIRHKKPYWLYSVGVFAAWGIIFLVRWRMDSPPQPKTLALIFVGYCIGWLGATIARFVYK